MKPDGRIGIAHLRNHHGQSDGDDDVHGHDFHPRWVPR